MHLPNLPEILRANPGWLDEAVDTTEASRITGRPVTTLETLRVRGGGPMFIQHGRKVTYRRRDLFDWMAAGLRTSTSGARARPIVPPCVIRGAPAPIGANVDLRKPQHASYCRELFRGSRDGQEIARPTDREDGGEPTQSTRVVTHDHKG